MSPPPKHWPPETLEEGIFAAILSASQLLFCEIGYQSGRYSCAGFSTSSHKTFWTNEQDHLNCDKMVPPLMGDSDEGSGYKEGSGY